MITTSDLPEAPKYRDIEIRVLFRQEAGYPVEITAHDTDQVFPMGYLPPDGLSELPPGSPELAARLSELLFADTKVRVAWAQTSGENPRRRLRLRLDPPELQRLPWELLRPPGATGIALAADQSTPFSRFHPSAVPAPPLISERPIRALVAIASPSDLAAYDLEQLDVKGEAASLATIAAAIDEGRLEADFLAPPVTCAALLAELQRGYHVLHLAAHGGFLSGSGEPGIFLADEDGRAKLVTRDHLTGVVGGLADSLRLVFLASCHSAAARDEARQAIAPALVTAGIPAVVAMRDRVPAATAREFAIGFYRRLESHGLVDLAANETRAQLLSRGLPGAASPVLYMRLPKGRLFVPTPSEPVRPEPDPVPLMPPAPDPARGERRKGNLLPAIDAEELLINGINGATGEYFHPPVVPDQGLSHFLGAPLASAATGVPPVGEDGNSGVTLGTGFDPLDLASAGWAVVFSRDADPRVRDALRPLIDHRRAQAGGRFRELGGEEGLRPGETSFAFLKRQGLPPGPVEPDRLPYYLLLVGGPEEIPYGFQPQLDIQYAIGRLALSGPDAYRRYAETVVASETARVSQPRRATFFGVRTPHDRTTELLVDYLLDPLARELGAGAANGGGTDHLPWQIDRIVGDDARKQRLADLLNGPQAPALLFSTSHGVAYPADHPRQLSHQGALLCCDWPGPEAWRGRRGEIPAEHIFAGADVSADARLDGLIAFHFACYGAGTPARRGYDPLIGKEAPPLASRDFVARLPQRLLEQGALAVVGHVDRALLCSFVWEGMADHRAFAQLCERLFQAHPVGWAISSLHERYGFLSAGLFEEVFRVQAGKRDTGEAKGLWLSALDAKNYVLLGDPAVRLPAATAAA